VAIPTNTVLPALTGTGVEFSLLTCTTGSWTGSPSSYTFLWRHSDFPASTIAGATGPTYTLTGADVGHSISCRVAATNADGTSPFAVAPLTVPPSPGLVAAWPRVPEVPEEERAAAFRAQCAARLQSLLERATRLRGDTAAAAAVSAAWAPVLPDPLDAWDCPCPTEPARPAWANRIPGDIELPEYLKREMPT
jgi:hypothetical protein